MIKVDLLRCPHGVEALSIADTRISSEKHCGKWNLVRFFRIDGIETIRIIRHEMKQLKKRGENKTNG